MMSSRKGVMMTTEPSEQRSATMAAIRSKDTGPELRVRRPLFRMGYRFRVHVKGLPGSPDIVLPSHRTVLQVQGCFWHQHFCRSGKIPKSNREYWTPKLVRNQARDVANARKLRRLGWSEHNLWECRLSRLDDHQLATLLEKLLEPNATGSSPGSAGEAVEV